MVERRGSFPQEGKEGLFERRQRTFSFIIDHGRSVDVADEQEEWRNKLALALREEEGIDRKLLQILAQKFGLILAPNQPLRVNTLVDLFIPRTKKAVVETTEVPPPPVIEVAPTPFEELLLDETLVPTEEEPMIEQGNGGWREKQRVPRFEMLLAFLAQNNFKIDDYFVIRGKNEPNMVRRESYVMVLIPSIKKMVLVCDEGGNATFVISDLTTRPEKYYRLTKTELHQAAAVKTIEWSNQEKWTEDIFSALTDESKEMTVDATEAAGLTTDELHAVVADRLRGEQASHEPARKFFEGIADEQLRRRQDTRKLYNQFLTVHELTEEQYRFERFIRVAYEIRQKRGIVVQESGRYAAAPLAAEFLEDAFTSLSDAELVRRGQFTKQYQAFLTKHALTEDDYSSKAFSNKWARLMKMRFSERPGRAEANAFLEKVDALLASVSTEEMGQRGTTRRLYNKLLLENQIKPDDYPFETFVSRAHEKREERNVRIANKGKLNPEILAKARDFIAKLSLEQKTKFTVRALYDLFLAENGLTEKEYSPSAFGGFFRRIDPVARTIRKPFYHAQSEILQKVDAFLDEQTTEELQQRGATRRLYDQLIAKGALGPDDYNFESFVARVSERRRDKDIRIHIKAEPEFIKKVDALFSGLTAEQLQERGLTRRMYDAFLAENNLTPEDYSFGAFAVRGADARKEKGVHLVSRTKSVSVDKK